LLLLLLLPISPRKKALVRSQESQHRWLQEKENSFAGTCDAHSILMMQGQGVETSLVGSSFVLATSITKNMKAHTQNNHGEYPFHGFPNRKSLKGLL
jgi:hypothetical protein